MDSLNGIPTIDLLYLKNPHVRVHGAGRGKHKDSAEIHCLIYGGKNSSPAVGIVRFSRRAFEELMYEGNAYLSALAREMRGEK